MQIKCRNYKYHDISLVILLLLAVSLLLLIHDCHGQEKPPTLPTRFTANFILSSPVVEEGTSSGAQGDTSSAEEYLLVPPNGEARVGIVYFDFKQGIVIHVFKPQVKYEHLYDTMHMLPYSSNSKSNNTTATSSSKTDNSKQRRQSSTQPTSAPSSSPSPPSSPIVTSPFASIPIQISFVGLCNMGEIATLYTIVNQQKCLVWGSIDRKHLPTELQIPTATTTTDTSASTTSYFQGNTVKNGVHAQEWKFPLRLVMYAHSDPMEYETFTITLFTSRFDNSIVQLDIEPTPFGVQKLQLKLFNMVLNKIVWTPQENDDNDGEYNETTFANEYVFKAPRMCY